MICRWDGISTSGPANASINVTLLVPMTVSCMLLLHTQFAIEHCFRGCGGMKAVRSGGSIIKTKPTVKL